MAFVPVREFEGLYEVNESGEVKSLCAKRKGIIRKPVPDKDGYLCILLKKDGKYYCKKIHRLVADAFIPNPMNYPMVNHKDTNKANNHVSNLEWCDCRYNNTYMGKHLIYCKKVALVDASGNIVKRYPSINDAAADAHITPPLISAVLNGKRKSSHGKTWRFI